MNLDIFRLQGKGQSFDLGVFVIRLPAWGDPSRPGARHDAQTGDLGDAARLKSKGRTLMRPFCIVKNCRVKNPFADEPVNQQRKD